MRGIAEWTHRPELLTICRNGPSGMLRRQKTEDDQRAGGRAYARPFRSLKFRLMALISVVLVLVVGLPVALFVLRIERDYDESVTTMMETTTVFVYESLIPHLIKSEKEGLQPSIEVLGRDPRIDRLRVLNRSGDIVSSSRPTEVGLNVFQMADSAFFRRDRGALEAFSKVGNVHVHHHPLYVEDRCQSCHGTNRDPIGTLDVYASFMDREATTHFVKYFSIAGGLLIIMILWTTTNLLYENLIESKLARILKGFQDLADGRLETRVEVRGQDEIGMLAARFNETVEQLSAMRQREEADHLEKLERADRLVTLGEIASEIAHEVNNPTGVILARAELIHEDIADRDPDDPVLEDVEMIIRQTGRIADITRSILHYARQRPPSFVPTNLADVVKRSLEVLEPRLRKSGARVSVELPETPLVLRADGNQLEQVFCNLFNNGLDAVHRNVPKLRVQGEVLEHADGVRICRLVIEDNGPGIPPELAEHVFSPFFTTKSDGAGTGLGLFIVRNIVHNHGGTIAVDPAPSAGARFVMEIPVDHGDT